MRSSQPSADLMKASSYAVSSTAVSIGRASSRVVHPYLFFGWLNASQRNYINARDGQCSSPPDKLVRQFRQDVYVEEDCKPTVNIPGRDSNPPSVAWSIVRVTSFRPRAAKRKKIECIGKMTQMTQEEIMTNSKTVVQGLEALKNEHNSILNGLTSSLELASERAQQVNVVEEKTGLVQKNLDMIELGLGEAQVS
uniref:Uncharacterized protein n=1 Tax=Timema douglasi TaxID=61478 RepID=A0A7R8ZDD4_TIMDO|nr:unnamed protein product [Timema douglasi]